MKTTLPAGTYYIGDPGYILDESMDTLLEVTSNFKKNHVLLNEKHVWVHATKDGDGTYTDTAGVEYDVDSGTLAAIPTELIEDFDGRALGTIYEAKNSLICSYKDGTFYFNDIVINTAMSGPVESVDYEDDFDEDDFKDVDLAFSSLFSHD